jgi:hypothetical protein
MILADQIYADHIKSLRQFAEIAKAELQAVEQQLAQMQALMLSREEIKASIFGLEKMIERMETAQRNAQQKSAPSNRPATVVAPAARRFEVGISDATSWQDAVMTVNEVPLWHGAKLVLESNPRPMSAPDITECMRAMGWPITGDTPVETVRTAMIRKPDVFERTERGMFSLKAQFTRVPIIRQTAPPPGPPPESVANYDIEITPVSSRIQIKNREEK